MTVGGAMKAAIRGQKKFHGGELREQLKADPAIAKLLEAVNPGVFQANLNYWTKQGYLSSSGGSPLEATFTVQQPEWFEA